MKSVCIGYFVCFLLVSFCFCGCENEEISPEVKILSVHNWTMDTASLRQLEKRTEYIGCRVLEFSLAFSESGNVKIDSYYEEYNDTCKVMSYGATGIYEIEGGIFTFYQADYYEDITLEELTESRLRIRNKYGTFFDGEYGFDACSKSSPIPIPSEWECVDCSDALKGLLKSKFTFHKSGYMQVQLVSGESHFVVFFITLGGNLLVKNLTFAFGESYDSFSRIQRNDVEGRGITIKSLQTKKPMAGTYMRFRRID